MTTSNKHRREPQPSDYTEGKEFVDWLYIALGVAVFVGLVLAATIGHHFVSLGLGQ
jgi:hypothetical protein